MIDRTGGDYVSVTGKSEIPANKHEKCRIRPAGKSGIYHVFVAPNGVQRRIFAPKGV